MKTQKQMILERLQKWGYIIPIDALTFFHCMSLAQRISELRKEGHSIETELIQNGRKRYAKYILKGQTTKRIINQDRYLI
jgi:hypothetical protein